MRYIFLICFAFWSQNVFPQTYDLNITVSGLKSTDGKIQIGLYNNKESFPLVDGQYKLYYIDVSDFQKFTQSDICLKGNMLLLSFMIIILTGYAIPIFWDPEGGLWIFKKL